MSRGPMYGLDAELAAKQAAKRDVGRESEARAWLEAVSGMKIEGTLHEGLKDGIILCTVANKIKPGVCRKVNKMKMPFMQMENINAYLDACKVIGVPQHEIFVTVDLFEEKDMNQVVLNVFALARAAQKTGFRGPALGPKLADKHEVEFTEGQMMEARGAMPALQAGMAKAGAQAGSAAIQHADIIMPGGSRHGYQGPT